MFDTTTLKLQTLVEKLMKDRSIVQNEIAEHYEHGNNDDILILFDRDVALSEEIEEIALLLNRQSAKA